MNTALHFIFFCGQDCPWGRGHNQRCVRSSLRPRAVASCSCEPLMGGAASGPCRAPVPGSSRWWGFGKRRRSAPGGVQRSPARSGRRGAQAWSGGGLAQSPLWPGCTSQWTSPPAQRSSQDESPSHSRPLCRHSWKLPPSPSPSRTLRTTTGQGGDIVMATKKGSGTLGPVTRCQAKLPPSLSWEETPHPSLNGWLALLLKSSEWPRVGMLLESVPRKRGLWGPVCLPLRGESTIPWHLFPATPLLAWAHTSPIAAESPISALYRLPGPAWRLKRPNWGQPSSHMEAGAAHQRRGATAPPAGSRGCPSAPAPAFWPCGTCTCRARTQRSGCSTTPPSSSPWPGGTAHRHPWVSPGVLGLCASPARAPAGLSRSGGVSLGTALHQLKAVDWPQPPPGPGLQGLTPLAPRSSMGVLLWKSLSRPWEAVGASCAQAPWWPPRGEVGLLG